MSSSTVAQGEITQEELEKFAAAWYFALDIHAPLEQCYTFLADDVVMQFPEAALDYNSFKDWYSTIVHTFFDENHNVQSVKITGSGAETLADVVVGWQASWFKGPAPKSKRTSMDAYQRWVVRRSTKNEYGIEIVKYYVDRFDYTPGFAQL